ncbi:MAG: IPT/TIG domain-containing protein, partial [Candidatus Magasanikbacteria bacterium]
NYGWRILSSAEQLTRYIVRVTAYDIDARSTTKETSFVVIGESCDPNGIEEKEGCPQDGGACEANWQCPSRRCVAGQCLVGSPTILDVDPWSAGAGSWITISGRKFGSDIGKIQFALEGTENWQDTAVVQCPGADSWTDTHVVVSVPDDALLPLDSKSAIRIIKANANGDSNFIDSTIDNFGPKPGPLVGLFTKNQDTYPGICGVNPNQVVAGGNVIVSGKDFGNEQGESKLVLGSVPGVIENPANWSAQTILTKVNQNMQAGIVSVRVTVDGKRSNGVPLQIVREADLQKPEIISVEPQAITPGSLITITGKNFGGSRGIVYLTNTAGTNCREENCFKLDFLDEPIECSQSAWNTTQIVAHVPANTNVGQFVVVVENAMNSSLYSTNDVKLSVENGDPKPGICALLPDNGPAPLPVGHRGLDIIGINFGEEPKVYFWSKNAVVSNNIADYERTWLSRVIPDAGILADGTILRTLIPTKDGVSMPSGKGPIVVRNGNQLSNPVYYNVSDCTKLDEVPVGYKCCTTSAGAGILQLEQLMCPGEVREAGYIWRFASGKIPSPPRVLESCELSSPAPSLHVGKSESACLNALITVAFSKNMDETDFLDNGGNIKNIHVFDCGKAREMSCDYAQDIANEFTLRSQRGGNAGHFIILEPKAGRLDPENWYRVVLENKLRSKEAVQVLGEEQIQQEFLITTRPLRDIPTSAYYFDFKTGSLTGGANGDGMCILKSARIRPSEYFTQLLGVIHYPTNSEDPLYYYVAGKADQNCIEIDVDDENWQWSINDDHIDVNPGPQLARVEKSVDDDYQNTRATVEALADSQARDVYILASLDKEPQDITATSSLVISLAKPRVRYYEPNCNASCINASIYVEFNLPMATKEYWTENNVLYQCENQNCYSEGVRIYKCLDANCLNSELVNVGLYNFSDISEKSFSLALKDNFTPNTYYKVELNGLSTGGKILSLNRINPPVAGKVLEKFSWSFRTKNDATPCEINEVGVTPELFTAR